MAANDLRVFRNVGLPDASTSQATSTVESLPSPFQGCRRT